MEDSIIKFLENLPGLLKTVALIGIAKGVIGIYTILHKENKSLRKENFELKDRLEESEQNQCTNCKIRVEEI